MIDLIVKFDNQLEKAIHMYEFSFQIFFLSFVECKSLILILIFFFTQTKNNTKYLVFVLVRQFLIHPYYGYYWYVMSEIEVLIFYDIWQCAISLAIILGCCMNELNSVKKFLSIRKFNIIFIELKRPCLKLI